MLAELKPYLDERQWRLTLGAQARALGRGGISRVAALTRSHPDTVSRGARELEQGIEPGGRVRQAGAGRPSATELDPGLVDALRKLVEPETRGDPMQPLVWTTKLTGNLAGELGRAGRPVSADTVGRLLKDRLGYSLQGNAKTIEGKQHPDRDAQFRYINDLVTWCLAAGIPVISIDCKKKELVGNFKNGGAEWEPKGSPRQVNDYYFADRQLGKVAPDGIYDAAANGGGERRNRPRDGGVRGGVRPPLGGSRPRLALPGCPPAAHHRGLRRFQRQPALFAEGGAGQARYRAPDRDHRRRRPPGASKGTKSSTGCSP